MYRPDEFFEVCQHYYRMGMDPPEQRPTHPDRPLEPIEVACERDRAWKAYAAAWRLRNMSPIRNMLEQINPPRPERPRITLTALLLGWCLGVATALLGVVLCRWG